MPFHVKKTVSFFNTTNELYWRACDFRSNITNVWTQRQLPFICGFYHCASGQDGMPVHVKKAVSFFNTTNELYWRACYFRSNITNVLSLNQPAFTEIFYFSPYDAPPIPFHVKKTVSFFNTTNELYWRACDFRSNITNVWTQRQLPFICGFYYCA